MKNLMIIILLIVLSSCTLFVSSDKMPFKVQGITKQSWTAGVAGGGRGTNYAVMLKMRTDAEIKVDTVWMDGYPFRPKLVEPNEKFDHHRLIMTQSERPDNVSQNEQDWNWKSSPEKAENPPQFDGTALIIYRFKGERREKVVNEPIERKERLDYP